MEGQNKERLFRGNAIYRKNGNSYYCLDDSLVSEKWKDKPCGHCGLSFTKEGHDGCLGTLPDTMNACCGHGVESEAYLQTPDSNVVRGKQALEAIRKRKGATMSNRYVIWNEATGKFVVGLVKKPTTSEKPGGMIS